MKCKHAQDWADFLGCYIVIYNKTVTVLDNFPKHIMFSTDGDIIDFSSKNDIVLDFGELYASIIETDYNFLYTPRLSSGDKVLVWENYYTNDTIPYIKIFKQCSNNNSGIEVKNDKNITEQYMHYLRFDKELSGLTIRELSEKFRRQL